MNVTQTFAITTEAYAPTTNDSLDNVTKNEGNTVELALYVALEVCIALFAFINNVLVIIALWKFHSLRTPTNWFVASLAVADIAVAIFAIPSAILLRFGLSINNPKCNDVIVGPSVGELMCLMIVSSVIFLTQVSIFGLLVIAIDRFIAINYPFKYSVFMTSNKTRAGIVAAWVLGGLIGVAPELGWNKWGGTTSDCGTNRCAFEEVISMEYMVYFNFFGCVLTPLIAMGVMYLFIFRSAKKQLRKIYFDVKDLKKKKKDFRSTEVLEQIKKAATTTFLSFGDDHHDNAEIKSRGCSLSPSTGCTLEFKEKVKENVATACCQRDFSEPPPYSTSPEIEENKTENARKRLNLNFPAQIRESESLTTNCESQLKEETESLHSNAETEKNCAIPTRRSVVFQAKSRDPIKRVTQRLRNRLKAQSLSYDDYCCDVTDREKEEAEIECPLRPCGKAHSFSASSSVIRKCLNENPGNSTYHIKATPIGELANEDSYSLNSSRSTIYMNDHGVWSTVEGANSNVQRKMKRKRQLLKKEFRAARSLATVVGLFAICWLPLHILNTLTLFAPNRRQPPWLKDLAILLSHANSLINPLIYAFKLRDFRKAFKRILSPILSPSNSDSDSSLNRLGPLKFCCIVTSPTQGTNDFTSEDKSASGDSWRERHHQRKTPILTPKVGDARNNNTTAFNDTSNRKRGFPDGVSTPNKTMTTLLENVSTPIISPCPRKSLPGATHECNSSNERLEMRFPLSNSDLGYNLFNSPETTV